MRRLDYVALCAGSPSVLKETAAVFEPYASTQGWRCAVRRSNLCVYVPEVDGPKVAVSSDGRRVLLGDGFRCGSASLIEEPERGRLLYDDEAHAVASGLLTKVWGRYVLVGQGTHTAFAMRDPSGAMECLGWRRQGCAIWASGLAAPADLLLPSDLRIDMDVLARLIDRPGEYHHDLAVTHIHPCIPGSLVSLGEGRAVVTPLWTPAGVYRRRPRSAAAPDEVRKVVQRSVRAMASLASFPICELSGGLDSAVVAAALGEDGRRPVQAWINHYTQAAGGDERRYVRAIAEHLAIDAVASRREFQPLTEAAFAPAEALARPATNDVDISYSRDMVTRVGNAGADAILTGQGGDAVFFQMPTPLIAIDEIMERAFLASPVKIVQIARWTRRSAWPHAWQQAWSARPVDGLEVHPWLNDLNGIPPAKTMQIRTIAACQTFHQPSLRSRAADLIHPLLSQPVLELGLAVPAPTLTSGGRDRSLIRTAFTGDLPSLIIDRTSKGDMSGFFGRDVGMNLPFLRRYLLHGRLADCGLLDIPKLDRQLTQEDLFQRGGSRRILSLALIEGWFRDWETRLAGLRDRDMAGWSLQQV